MLLIMTLPSFNVENVMYNLSAAHISQSLNPTPSFPFEFCCCLPEITNSSTGGRNCTVMYLTRILVCLLIWSMAGSGTARSRSANVLVLTATSRAGAAYSVCSSTYYSLPQLGVAWDMLLFISLPIYLCNNVTSLDFAIRRTITYIQ